MATLKPAVIDGSLVNMRQHLEELLQESENRFRLIADATPVMIWMADANQLCNYFNQVWLDFTGCSLEQQLGNDWTQDIHPEDKQQRQTIYSTAFYAHQKFQTEYRLRRADGEYRWLLDTGVPRFTSNGSFVGYIGSCVDISDRKQAEEKLHQKTAEQQAILQAMPGLYFRLDSDGTILDYNASNSSNLYLPPESFLGKRMPEVLPPSLGEQFQTRISQVLQTQTLLNCEYFLPIENQEGIFEACLIPLQDSQIIVVVREITVRVRAEAGLRQAINQLQIERQEHLQVQEALTKQHQQQRLILDSIPAMIWFKDTENRILQLNQAAAQAIGLQVEEIEGKSVYEIYPDDAAKYYQDDLEVIHSGLPKLGIIELVKTASGEKRWTQTDKIPWRDDHGTIAGIIVFTVDVTERQLTQMLLQESLARFNLVATASQEGLWDAWVISDDPVNPNNPVYYSPRFKELLGYEDQEFENTLGRWTSRIHPEDSDRVLAALTAHLKHKTPYHRIEYRILTKSGEYRWFSASGQAIWDVSGNPVRVAGSLRDITVRKQAEAALRQSEERLRTVIANAPIILWAIDREGIFTLLQGKALEALGLNSGQLVGQSAFELFHDTPIVLELITQALAGESIDAVTELGGLIFDARMRPICNQSGEVTSVIGISIDVTQIKQVEAERDALREASQRVFNVSVDILGTVGFDGYFKQVNPAVTTVLGYMPEEFMSVPYLELIHPDDRAQTVLETQTLVSGAHSLLFENRYRCKDGSYKWLAWNTVSFPEEELIYCSARNITKRKQAEQALHESERRFQTLARVSPVGIYHTDAQGQVLYVNERWCEMAGLTPNEAMAEGWVKAIHPDDRKQFFTTWEQSVRENFPFQLEHRFRRPDGKVTWVLAQAIAELDEAGVVQGYVGTITDISDRKALEKELALRQVRFDAFFTSAPAGLMILDDQLRFVHINETLAQMNQHTVADHIGRTLTDMVPAIAPTLVPMFRQILTTGEPILNHELSAESLKQPGVRLYCMASYFPLAGEEGKPIGIGAVVINITERKQAEAALRESEERFRAIFDQAAVGINLTELDGSWLIVNQKFCDLMGYSQKEMLARTSKEISHPEELDAELERIRRLLAGEIQTFSMEKRYLHKQGFQVWVNLTVSLVRSPQGEPKYLISVVQDISDRKALEKELALRQARFDAFFTSAPVGLEIIDDQLRFAHINETLARMDGCSVAEHLGKTVAEIVPEMASDLEAMYQHILMTGESILNLEQTGETPKEPGVQRHWISSCFPLLGEEGKPIAIGGVTVEITERKRTEEALKASEAQLRLALNAAQMGVWDWNLETGNVIHSEREEAIFGLAPGEFDGNYRTYFKSIHPQDQSRVVQANLRTIEEGAEYDIDYRIIWPDQDVHWIREKGAVLRDETGKAVRMIGITMDITEHKQAEEFLRQSEERYRKLAQQEELLYRIASQIRNSLNLETILETAVAEIRTLLQIDRCLFIWFHIHAESAVWEVVHEAKRPDLPSVLGCYPAEALAPLVQPPFNSEVLRVDNVQTLQDDALRKFFQSLGYNSLLNLPIQTPSGEVGVVACVNCYGVRPWTDEEVEMLCAVCDQLAIAINQAELYAQSRAAATVATEKASQLELALHSLQQTQAQLIQTEKMSSLGQLVAGLAHEINNPVSFIYGNVDHASAYIKDLLNLLALYRTAYPQPLPEIQVLAESIDLDFLLKDLPKVLSSMKVGADRIRDLVLSLRNFSRLDEAEKKPVDIHEGLNNTLLILQHRLKQTAGNPAIQVIKTYGQLPLVNCYPGQLNQVFMNLLTNAIDALEQSVVSGQWSVVSENTMEKQPMIWISTETNEGGYITIRITDNGPGMTQEILSRLFDPFFTTKPIGKGTGLGLSISYQIVVEKHKGTLHCHSLAGKGTEFVVTLPQ
jgi:PAS domain S-box-containing protein